MKKYLPYIVILALALVSFNLYTEKKADNSRYKSNLLALNDSVKYHKNKFGDEVASKRALQFTLSELKDYSKENKELKETIKKFKKPLVVIQTEQVVRIDTIYRQFKDSIKYVFSKDINILNKDYAFNLNINQTGFKIDNFSIFNTQSIVVGWKKQGLFKSPIATAEITNTNKYFKQTKIKPFIIVYKRKWHEKIYFTVPIGIILGYGLSR